MIFLPWSRSRSWKSKSHKNIWLNSRLFRMIKKKFKRGFHPIVYREKKGERQSVEAFVSRKKRARMGALLVWRFCTTHTSSQIFLTFCMNTGLFRVYTDNYKSFLCNCLLMLFFSSVSEGTREKGLVKQKHQVECRHLYQNKSNNEPRIKSCEKRKKERRYTIIFIIIMESSGKLAFTFIMCLA